MPGKVDAPSSMLEKVDTPPPANAPEPYYGLNATSLTPQLFYNFIIDKLRGGQIALFTSKNDYTERKTNANY